jgi:glyoxylase-like metal-dependent hydrolase (beta-lactamase superfamily II)
MIFSFHIANGVPLAFLTVLNRPALEPSVYPAMLTPMAKPEAELTQVSARLHFWQIYDASVKADLFATAIEASGGVVFVDPVPLPGELLEQLLNGHPIAGVFVTNANHCRAAREFSEKLSAPIFAHEATCAACEFPSAREVKDGSSFAEKVCAVAIEGAVAGEMAIYHENDGNAVVMGDALINFEPYGFTFLPPKYCTNAKEMRRSLRRLLDFDFERMLFAHGIPLMHSARKKLERLLQGSD